MRLLSVVTAALLLTAVVGSTVVADAGTTQSAQEQSSFAAAGSQTWDFSFDLGEPGQSVVYTFSSGGSAGGTIELHEFVEGTPYLIESLSLDEANSVTVTGESAFHEGVATFRVVVNASAAGDNHWSFSFANAGTPELAEDDHRRGRRHHCCSTSDASSGIMALLAALALIGIAARFAFAKSA